MDNSSCSYIRLESIQMMLLMMLMMMLFDDDDVVFFLCVMMMWKIYLVYILCINVLVY